MYALPDHRSCPYVCRRANVHSAANHRARGNVNMSTDAAIMLDHCRRVHQHMFRQPSGRMNDCTGQNLTTCS